MKKIVLGLSLVLLLTTGTILAFAESSAGGEAYSWFRERMGYRQDSLKEALEKGEITQDQYNIWNDHYEYMEEFHNENGFMNGGPGTCHGGRGFGGGMRYRNSL